MNASELQEGLLVIHDTGVKGVVVLNDDQEAEDEFVLIDTGNVLSMPDAADDELLVEIAHIQPYLVNSKQLIIPYWQSIDEALAEAHN